jgi:hypothetical protein
MIQAVAEDRVGVVLKHGKEKGGLWKLKSII